MRDENQPTSFGRIARPAEWVARLAGTIIAAGCSTLAAFLWALIPGLLVVTVWALVIHWQVEKVKASR